MVYLTKLEVDLPQHVNSQLYYHKGTMNVASMIRGLISTELSRVFRAGSGLIDHCLVMDSLVGCGL